MITATFTCSLDVTFLPTQLIYEDKTEKSISKVNLAKGYSLGANPKYFNNEEKGSENIAGPLFCACEKREKNWAI